MSQLAHQLPRDRVLWGEQRRVALASRRRPFRLQRRDWMPQIARMATGIGTGLGMPYSGGSLAGWFNSATYNDMAMVADFNNWRFALPAWGAEVIASPTVGWGANAGWVVGAGVYTATTSSNTVYYNTGATLVQRGKLYRVRFDMTRSAGSVSAQAYGTTTQNISPSYSTTASGVEFTFTPSEDQTYIQFLGSGFTGTISNVSVREVILTRGGAALGANLGASGYTMSVTGGTATATESPTGQLNLTGDGVNTAQANKSFTTVVGRKYRVMCSVATNAVAYSVGTSSGGTQNIPLTVGGTGFISAEFTATATTHWIGFFRNSAGLSTVTAIEIRELPATGAFPKRLATFDEFFAFTATSTTARSYVDSTGTTWKNDLSANAPRRDYRNGKQQWRLEDARTNLCVYSTDVSSAEWSEFGAAKLTGQPDPFGGVGAARITADGGSGNHRLTPSGTSTISYTSGTTYTISRIVKPGSQTLLQLSGNTAAFGGSQYANYSLAGAGSVTASTGLTSSGIQALPNGWYRIWITLPATATVGSQAGFVTFISTGTDTRLPTNTLATNYTDFGAQVEAGAFPSDLIVTTSAAVTRAIETARFSPLVEAVLQRAGGSAVVRGIMDALISTARIIGAVDSPLIGASSGNLFQSFNGTTALNTANAIGLAAYGAATGYDSAGRSIVGNGGTVATDTNQPPVRTSLLLARPVSSPSASSAYAAGLYDFVGFSPERLANANLQALAVAA